MDRIVQSLLGIGMVGACRQGRGCCDRMQDCEDTMAGADLAWIEPGRTEAGPGCYGECIFKTSHDRLCVCLHMQCEYI